MEREKPFFMTNKEWFYFDENNDIYKLTDKAPLKAVKSYEKYYADTFYFDKNGVMWNIDY